MTSMIWDNVMLKIDWAQVKNLKAHLLRQGYTEESDVTVMILYRGKTESQQAKIKLGTLEKVLFDICDHVDVTGFYLFDAELKKPLWKIKEVEHTNTLESIPSSGHPSIIRDFDNMTPEQKDIWVKITEASVQQFMANEV